MDVYGRNQGPEIDHPRTQWGETGLQGAESMWKLGISDPETYPERPGVSDCVYYMRNGLCGFGSRCRYNHPHDRDAAVVAARLVGDYPERPGELPCQYYLKTGTCKFGVTCKFHHPRNAGGILNNAPLNYHGLPLRPGEKECSYYLQTGQCKFGRTCKFHHPQPAGMSIPAPAPAPPFYPTVQTPSVPIPEQASRLSPNYRVARTPFVPGSYTPGSYGPVLLPPGVVPMPGWGSYSGPVRPALSPGTQTVGGTAYGVTPVSPSTPGLAGSYPTFPTSLGQSRNNAKECNFPERPGEPECQYYLKTGGCKFGTSCRFHHPLDRAASTAACLLGPLGLPLRPGTQPCTFYMQNGYCKFGTTCKFDHPVGLLKCNPSASSLTEMPVSPYLGGSTSPVFHPSSSASMGLILPEYAIPSGQTPAPLTNEEVGHSRQSSLSSGS